MGIFNSATGADNKSGLNECVSLRLQQRCTIRYALWPTGFAWQYNNVRAQGNRSFVQ